MVLLAWIPFALAQDADDVPDPPSRLDASEVTGEILDADGSVRESTVLSDLPDPPDDDAPLPELGEDETWLRMDSGEWLRGELKRMRLDRATFKSKDLGTLDLDWDDVAALWSPRAHVWDMGNRERLIGPARLRGEVLEIRTSEGIVALSPDQVTSMRKGDGAELGFWAYSLYAGLTGRWGNARQLAFVGRSDLTRDDGRTRWNLHYDGTYGTTEGVPSANAHTGSTQLDVYVHEVVFITPLSDTVYHDPFQNIRVRNRVGAGLGFRHEATAKVTWSGAVNALHQYQEAISVSDPADAAAHDVGLSLGLDAKFEPVSDMTIKTGWTSTLVLTDLGGTSHRGLASIGYKVADALGLDVQVQYDRIEQPVALADGTVPVSDDVQLSAGVSLDF